MRNHRFKGHIDGKDPEAGLASVGGVLYGTTFAGGVKDVGTVFRVTRTGNERVLHAFRRADGANPSARLINVKGTLYGTTKMGGSADAGTVFSLVLR